MNPQLFRALALLLLVAELVAQFIAHSQSWATVAFLLVLALVAVRVAMGPETATDEECPADCRKCAEDLL
ncbi:hypothetical protein ACFY6Q_32640 [[Kitasatospora] papulosa]|uniref:hypothetical protein n=1 Tax=[Kitasatospora] papulosa TaxID=1464011 RepID=UPI0036B2813E